MKLEINCPECGYNSYKVVEISTGNSLSVIVAKCETGGCNIEIDNLEFEHYEDFSELTSFFNNRFNIVDIIGQNCVD